MPKCAEPLLERFEKTKYLRKIKVIPVQSTVCPIDSKEFAKFLGALFSSSFLLTPDDKDKFVFQQFSQFRLEEIEIALKGMANLCGIDEDGIVVEMIKQALQ